MAGMPPNSRAVRRIFSEAGLMRERVRVECAWFLRAGGGSRGARARRAAARRHGSARGACRADPAATDVAAIKQIEARTNHDVKAVEYWLRGELQARGATAAGTGMDAFWLHFGGYQQSRLCADAEERARDAAAAHAATHLQDSLDALAAPPRRRRHVGAHSWADRDAHHGWARNSPMSPHGSRRSAAAIERIAILGKMNGAVGNFNAHVAALPQVDWPAFSAAFVESLGPGIEPLYHADRAARLDCRVLPCADARQHRAVGFCARHVELHFVRLFQAAARRGEVGSSTMPHKVNPIDFENAEGNLGIGQCAAGAFRRQAAAVALAARPDRFDGAAQCRRGDRTLRS